MAFYKSNYFALKISILIIFINMAGASDIYTTKNTIYPHNRKLTETYSGEKLDGLIKLYYKNGLPEWRYTFYEGRLHGLITHWNPSGLIIMEGYFNSGDSSGVWRWYDETGENTKTKNFGKNIFLKNFQKKRYIMKVKDI